jgi:hypothetical protein
LFSIWAVAERPSMNTHSSVRYSLILNTAVAQAKIPACHRLTTVCPLRPSNLRLVLAARPDSSVRSAKSGRPVERALRFDKGRGLPAENPHVDVWGCFPNLRPSINRGRPPVLGMMCSGFYEISIDFHKGKFALIHGEELVGVFGTYEDALMHWRRATNSSTLSHSW